MWRWLVLALGAILIVVFGFSLIDNNSGGSVNATTEFAAVSSDTTGYTRAIEPRTWNFPQDFGAHPDFQTEWWYYTGNVTTADGHRFGYQFTIFRRAIQPPDKTVASTSEWRSNQIYMAHFAVSDMVAGNIITYSDSVAAAQNWQAQPATQLIMFGLKTGRSTPVMPTPRTQR